MKKILLASTALVAVGFVSAAQAAEPVKLGLGGYMKEWVGYATNKDETIIASTVGGDATSGSAANKRSKVDQQSDNYISFIGSTKLDNGLSVAVQVDTRASQGTSSKQGGNNANVRRAYVSTSGGFGALILGQRENVGYIIHNSAPDVGVGLQDGDVAAGNWIVNPTNHGLYNTTWAKYDGNADKVIYVTPAFYGVTGGVSYTPDIARSGTTGGYGDYTMPSSSDRNNGAAAGDLYVGGLAYANEIAGVKVKADAGYGVANVAGLSVQQYGLNLSYAGFTVGGSALKRLVDAQNLSIAAQGGLSWDAGVSYTTGPYAVSVGYFHDSETAKMAVGRDTTAVWQLSGAYILGPGVTWKSSLAQDTMKSGDGTAANENKGWAAITGLRVDF